MELYEISASNFGPYEEFVLPLYKCGLVWIGGVNKDTAAADSNGSGKSTIFKALTWGLYGDSIDGEKGDKVIRAGAKKAIVKVTLVDDKGGKWYIVRERSKGTPRVKLIRPSGKEFEGDKSITQERIVRMVGLDFKAFKNTVLYGQNDSSRFAHPNTKDSDRKMMLHRILNTELLTFCYDKTKNIVKDLRVDNRELEHALHATIIIRDENDVSGLEKSHSEYEEAREEKINHHTTLASKFRDRARELVKQSRRSSEFPELLRSIEKKIAKKKKQISVAEKESKKSDALLEESQYLDIECAEAISTKNIVIRELGDIARQLRLLKNDRCPTCTTPLDGGAAFEYITSLEKQKKKIEKKIAVAEESVSNKKSVYDKKRGEYLESVVCIDKFHALMRESAKLAEKLSAVKHDVEVETLRCYELKITATALAGQAKSELSLAKEAVNAVNPYEVQLEKAKTRAEEHNAKIEKLENEIAKKNEELSYYEFWVKGFSNQGLPSYVLDGVMPYITERTNHYLETLTDGDITMEFSTQRELKSAKGEMRDEIDIHWEIEGTEKYPPSGGQLKKMEVATDLALMDLVSTNEGGNLDLMMFDEVLDGLDAEGCSRVLLLLQKLRAIRGSIFVVSHESSMSEVFEKGIFAVKDGGIARLEADGKFNI